MTSGEPATFLKKISMTKTFGFELIESIITTNPSLFTKHPHLLKLLKEKVCPLLIRCFSEKHEFSQTLRLMRVVQSIVRNFHSILVMPCEIFLSMYSKLLEAEQVPIWQVILILECYRSFFSEDGLARFVNLM